jgi:tetratricopeptide (TPR) repeat protein/capsular polysaccharide biosynthesis protein
MRGAKLARTIAFVGNCQMQALQTLYDRYASGHTSEKTVFLPSYRENGEASLARLPDIDLVVEQVQALEPDVTLPEALRSVERVRVPLVSAAFLWPFAGEQHPSNVSHPYLDGGPYPGELGDGFLNRLIHKNVSPDEAVVQYQAHLFNEDALDRRYELTIDRQHRRDEICGFSIAPEIERFFRTEALFSSPHHPGLRVTQTLATQCFPRVGAPRISIDLLNIHLRRSPFPQDQLPIHPSVARHFKLSYVNADSTFSFRGEGCFSWEQWVRRYMRCSWEPELYEATAISEVAAARARDLLVGVLERLPNSHMAHLSLAKALSRLGDGERAASEACKAIALDVENPDAWRVAAQIAMQRRRPDEARQCTVRAVAGDPSDIGNLGLLAKVQEDMKDFVGAEWTRRSVTFLFPLAPDHRAALGTTLMHQKGKAEEALAEYTRAIALDPRHAGARFGSSIVLAELGRVDEAIEAVQIAVEVNPNVALYHSHLGHLLGRSERREEAIEAFARALELAPLDAGIHSVISDLMSREGQHEGALGHMKRAVEIEPHANRYLLRLSQMLVDQKRFPEAVPPLSQAIALRPEDAALRLRLGVLFARSGRLEEAVTELEAALRLSPQDAEASYELSSVLESIGNFAGAQRAIDRALELMPTDEKFMKQHQRLGELDRGALFARVPSRYLFQSSETVVPQVQITTPKCLVYSNFAKLNPEFAQHHFRNLYIERERYLPPVSVGRLDRTVELFVPNGEDFIPFCGSKVVGDQVRPNWGDQELHDARLRCTREAEIVGPTALIGRFGIRTWGHWLGELLPKLVAVEAMMPNRFRYILPHRMVTDPIHRTGLEALQYYGIGVDRLALVSAETIYHAADLHVVTPTWSLDHMIHPMVAELMRTHGQSRRELSGGPERVALLRRGARTRKLVNLEAIQGFLERHGWAVLDLETMNFADQANLFRNAKWIVSVLGSGLTGLIYAPGNVKILSLAPSHWGDLFFFALMQERSAKLADVRGTSEASTPGTIATANFSVDLAEIEIALSRLDEG